MAAVNPPTIDEVRDAVERLRDVALATPLVPLHTYDGTVDILLKPEVLQPVNSFKLRGIFNAVAVLSAEQRAQGISTVSAGNTAQALAWVGRRFGISARSVMPENAPSSKIEAVRDYGGTPVLLPPEDVFRYLREHGWEQEPYTFIHPWTNRHVMIGHASLAVEILAECPQVESVFVPVGGGGLIGGVGTILKALRPDVRLYAVEPAGCPALASSLKQGAPVTVECRTMCDGVAVPYITDEMFPLLNRIVDESVLVSEDAVSAAVERLVKGNKIVSEPSGALATAAALSVPPDQRGKSVCLVTGGSIDTAKLVSLLADGAP